MSEEPVFGVVTFPAPQTQADYGVCPVTNKHSAFEKCRKIYKLVGESFLLIPPKGENAERNS